METQEGHWEKALNALWESAQQRHGGKIRLRPKREARRFWSFLAWLLRLVTFRRGVDLLDGNYYTLIGHTIWLPGDGSAHEGLSAYMRFSILSHEIDHLDWIFFGDHDARHKDASQLKKRGLLRLAFHWWKYLFWPLPYKFARYRERVEAWAFSRALEQHLVAHDGKCTRWFRKWLVLQFCSSVYAWTCTQERAYETVDKMIAEVEESYQAGKLNHLKES